MPYQPHTHLKGPADEDARLWRYMSFERLLSVLIDRALYFPSAGTLAKSDKFEAQPTVGEVGLLQNIRYTYEGEHSGHERDQLEGLLEVPTADEKNRVEASLRTAFVSCWHANDTESDAMWKIYGRENGIAIRTTFGRLKESFGGASEPIYIGEVEYVSEGHVGNRVIWVHALFRKRSPFSHENELRAICIDANRADQPGIKIPIDLCALIETVIISPYSEYWFGGLVEKITKKLGYHFTVVPSMASGPPPSASLRFNDG